MKIMAIEIVITALILAFTSALATGYVNLPHNVLNSYLAVVALVLISLGAFMVAPAAGLSLFLLTAVVFFKRNVDNTLSRSSTYGETSIRELVPNDAMPFNTQSSGPREYEQFQETDASNPMLGNSVEDPNIENFEPAPYGDEQGSPVDGQYPKEDPRASGTASPADFTYRPEEDTGSNEFSRFGPDLDEKKMTMVY
jgi:hypothetical protein